MQSLNIAKKHNQKALIFLLKSDLGVFAIAALASNGSFRVTDTKLISSEELSVLQSQKELLQNRGIETIDLIEQNETNIDLSNYATVLLLPGTIASIPTYEAFSSIPSPYFIFSFNDSQFFSTQKTRGPNMF
jgi:hypothetical protein